MAQVTAGIAPAAVRLALGGIEADSLAVILEGVLLLLEITVSIAAVVIGVGLGGIQADGLVVILSAITRGFEIAANCVLQQSPPCGMRVSQSGAAGSIPLSPAGERS